MVSLPVNYWSKRDLTTINMNSLILHTYKHLHTGTEETVTTETDATTILEGPEVYVLLKPAAEALLHKGCPLRFTLQPLPLGEEVNWQTKTQPSSGLQRKWRKLSSCEYGGRKWYTATQHAMGGKNVNTQLHVVLNTQFICIYRLDTFQQAYTYPYSPSQLCWKF